VVGDKAFRRRQPSEFGQQGFGFLWVWNVLDEALNEKWATKRFCIENHIFSLSLDVLRSFLLPSRASRYLSRAAAPA